jgi:hypothetical protein
MAEHARVTGNAEYREGGGTNITIRCGDLARPHGRAVQLESVLGPLSAAQSKAILKGVQGGQQTSIFDRHLAREEAMVDRPLTTGNQVLLLQDGPATYQAMLAAIHDRRRHTSAGRNWTKGPCKACCMGGAQHGRPPERQVARRHKGRGVWAWAWALTMPSCGERDDKLNRHSEVTYCGCKASFVRLAPH